MAAPAQLSLWHKDTSWQPRTYAFRVSAFSDSGELGFHWSRIRRILQESRHSKVEIVCNAASWGYDWDYAHDYDPELDFYLPPSLPLPALVEFARFIRVMQCMKMSNLKVSVVFPPKNHAATQFVEASGLLDVTPRPSVTYADHPGHVAFLPGCDDVLIPLTHIGPETDGQLSVQFYQGFERLANAGKLMPEYRSSLRKVVMEAAENAEFWGQQGWVACFLRQDKRGGSRFGHKVASFSPLQETHLFLHVISTGPTLAATTGMANEWEAADAISSGFSARPIGGGKGFPGVVKTVVDSAVGTIFISSGGYSRILTPDGLVREFVSAGSEYLPGVHICAVVPLAVVSDNSTAPKIKPQVFAV